MATIQTAIRLNDMMTAPIRNITNAMNMMLSSWTRLESSTSGGLDVGSVEAIRSELNQANQALDQMRNKQQDFNQKVREGATATDNLIKRIKDAVGAYVGFQSVMKVVNLSDGFAQTNARLGMIVDSGSNVEELFDKITASANRSRASISSTADSVAKLSLSAPKIFASDDETILFVETLNKMYAIAGTNQAGMASATLQLTQAMGSGVLRGEEFNAVYEAAPQILHKVAESMGKPIEELRALAQEGKISAAVVKNALLGAAQEVDNEFQNMDMTWAQVWTQAMNGLYYASIPLLKVINWLANNISIITPLVLGLGTAFVIFQVAAHWTQIATIATTAYHAVINFLSIGFGMLTGSTAAASASVFTFNSALLASPVTWWLMVIVAIVGAFYAVIAVINKVTGTTISATGVIVGALTAAVSIIWNLLLTLLSLIIQSVLVPLTTAWDNFANFFGNIFTDPIATIIRLFENLANTVLGILKTIASGIDAIFGTNLAGTVQGWMDGVSGKADELVEKYGNGTYEEKSNLTGQLQGMLTDAQTAFSWQTSDAYNTGYNWGVGVEDSVGKFFGGGSDEYSMEKLLEGVQGIEGNTGNISDALDVTKDNLKYLRDVAEQEVVNRFTTAEVRVELGGVTNNVNSNMDLDGVVDYFVGATQEALERTAEGAYA